jgi:hypothetical protein
MLIPDMATSWRRRRARGAGVVAALALVAVVVADLARLVVFDLEPPAPESAAAGAAGPDIYPGSPWTSLPRLLPGSLTFHLHPAPTARLDLALDAGRAAAGSGRLDVAVNGKRFTTVDVAGDVGPAHRRYRVRIPPGALGSGSSGDLTLGTESPAAVRLDHVRLVEARPSLSLRHLARRGRFPPESAVFLAASLAALLLWRPEPREGARRFRVRIVGAAATLALLALGATLPPRWALVADVPRWLWLAAPWPWLLLGLWPAGEHSPARAWVANGLLMVTSLAVAIGSAELAVRFVYRDVQSSADARAYFTRRQAEQNSLGFREREFALAKPPSTYRIAVMGDSLSWGIGVSPGERFSGQLEEALNARRRSGRRYEVLNFARSGWDTADELDALRRVVLGTGVDFVVLQWYLNDFENGVRQERPQPAPLVPWEPVRLWLFRASALYSVLEDRWVRVQEWLGAIPTYAEYMYRRFGDPHSPHSAAAVDSLRAFIAECREHAVPLTVVLFPHPGPDLAARRYEFDYLHDRVLETCRGEGLDCVDLRAAFATQADYRLLWVSPLDPHPSVLAHRLAAERLLAAFEPIWLGAALPGS